MSIARQQARGRRKEVWNSVTETFDHYRLTKRGKWVLVIPFTNRDVLGAEPLTHHEIGKLEKTD